VKIIETESERKFTIEATDTELKVLLNVIGPASNHQYPGSYEIYQAIDNALYRDERTV
jgi:hypothetical protein